MGNKNEKRMIGEGRFLRLIDENGWEYVERKNTKSVVAVVNRTKSGHVLLVEQFRPAVNHHVIEWPAGLVGDEGDPDESLETAAKRELLEETGYKAERITELITGPSSTGVTSEVITYVMASGLEKNGNGGGIGDERITVHEVPANEVDAWLRKKIESGVQVDPRVYVGLYFIAKAE